MDDNDLLKIHLADSAMKMESGNERAHPRKMLVKISNKAHVDGMAMLFDALAVRVFNWDKLGSRLENRRRTKEKAEERTAAEDDEVKTDGNV